MNNYRFTKVYEVYYDAYVEADSLEEAISMIDSDELEWEEDLETRILSRTTWSLLDENGDTEEDGIVEE